MMEFELKNKKLNTDKLLFFGFTLNDGIYTYRRDIADGNMKLKIAVKTDGRILTEIIDSGSEEEYVLHLECSMTYFRKVIKTDINEISYSIPKERVNGEIAVLSMVVAKRRIVSFTSEDLNEDYDGESISFDKASILAYQNLPKIQVFKNYEELAGNESLFAVVKVGLPDDEEVHPLSFDLNDDRIKIMVDAKTYACYIHYQQKGSVAMSLLVLPAVIYMLDELRGSPESFSSKMWFVKMKQYYKSQGLDFIEDIVQGKNIVEAAQEMLKSPIGKAYRELIEDEG